MDTSRYWTRRVGRRTALRGAGVGIAGLAGAALIGCGGGGDDGDAVPEAQATAPAQGVAQGDFSSLGKVGADQVRVKPGAYTEPIPPTGAERDILANGRYGGTILARYLDPPSMDFNRTLSCTINSTMDMTKNKLTRAAFGPKSDMFRVTIEPDLAESWEVNADATQFTFHLHKGVKFHNVAPTNGREFTSDDVKATVERYKAGGTQQDVWAVVDSMEFPDKYTAVFKLNQPLADFPRNIAAWSHMDAREMVENNDFLKEHAVGTGPFLQAEWTKKERSVFTKHPEYFEKGLPFVDRVIMVVQNDEAIQRAGFQTDNWFYWSARDEPDAQSMLDSHGKDAVYLKFFAVVGANTEGIGFQQKNPKLQDVRVRRAFALSIDFEEWDAARYAGENQGYVRSPIPWPYLHQTKPTLKDLSQWYQFDPAQASQLLQAAGYSATNKLTLDGPVWYQREQYRSIMAPMLDKIPELEFKAREVDNPTAVQMLNDRNFDDTMNITFGPPVYAVDQALYPFFHSTGGLNHFSVNDPEMDRLATAQRRELNPERQKELWKQAEDRIFDQVWSVYFPGVAINRIFWHNYAVNFRPHGIATVTSCYGDGKLRSIWLDEGAPNATAVLPGAFGSDIA